MSASLFDAGIVRVLRYIHTALLKIISNLIGLLPHSGLKPATSPSLIKRHSRCHPIPRILGDMHRDYMSSTHRKNKLQMFMIGLRLRGVAQLLIRGCYVNFGLSADHKHSQRTAARSGRNHGHIFRRVPGHRRVLRPGMSIGTGAFATLLLFTQPGGVSRLPGAVRAETPFAPVPV